MVAYLTVPAMWHQFLLMVNAQQTFVASRLMNWYGDDLHRVAGRHINEGNYQLAAHILKQQGKELKDVEEGKTADKISDGLIQTAAAAQTLREEVERRAEASGFMRTDFILLGVSDAMLPAFTYGAERAPSSLEGASKLRSYREALHKVAELCTTQRSEQASMVELGMAASALGYARWPRLIYGRAESSTDRASVLCAFLKDQSTEALDGMHRAAFSVSEETVRHDWRAGTAQGALFTPADMAARAMTRAIDTVLQRVIGWGRVTAVLPEHSAFAEEDPPATPTVPPLEAAVIAAMPAAEMTDAKGDYQSFTPVVHDPIGLALQRNMEIRVAHGPNGAVMRMCFRNPGEESGVSLEHRMLADGRLEVRVSAQCPEEVDSAEKVIKLTPRVQTSLGRFVELADSGRAFGAPPEWRALMCKLLTSPMGNVDSLAIAAGVRSCPVEVAAQKESNASQRWTPGDEGESNDESGPTEKEGR